MAPSLGSFIVNVSYRIGVAIAFGFAMLAAPVGAASKPGDRKAPPTLKDVDAAPANFLGQSLQLVGWLAPTTTAVGTGAELSVSVEPKSPPSRLRFLIPTSLAAAVAELKEPRRARIAGTVLAAESVRAGYVFEVDEIAVLDDADKVVATLKPAAGPRPTVETTPVEPPAAKEKELPKPAEAAKKGGVPTILIVGASLMAALLVVLSVIGFRLLKYMKKRPKPTSRAKRDAAATETVEA